MSANLNLFFEALATRAYKENDLSDVTYAMCQSDMVFKKFFLDFFFPSANLNAEDAIFEREHSTDNGRPDFWIRANDKTYIVEVKIWDGNHHFEQYHQILKAENKLREDAWQYLGYITNYKFEHDDVTVKTWKELYDSLKSYNGLNDPAVIAYMSYIKGVCWFETCYIDDFKFNPESFKRIKELSQEIDNCVDGKKTEKIVTYNRSTNLKSKCWMGRHFELKDFKDEKSIWGFLGVTYKDNVANICVSFRDQNGWAKLLCNDYRDQIKNLKSNYKDGAIAYEDSNLVFYMTEKDKTVSNFFTTVLKEITNNQFDRADKNRYKDVDLIAMKKLPLYLEQKLFDWELNPNTKFKIQLSEDQKDSEYPNGYCGRYFELISEDNPMLPIRGWVGALYCNSNEPEFVIQIEKNSSISDNLEDWPVDKTNPAWKNSVYKKEEKGLDKIKEWFRGEIRKITQTTSSSES